MYTYMCMYKFVEGRCQTKSNNRESGGEGGGGDTVLMLIFFKDRTGGKAGACL